MQQAWIGIGTNLGNRKQNIRKALTLLCQNFKLLQISLPIKTKPYGDTDQANFINLVVSLQTKLSASDLLTRLLEIENEMGRIRTRHWGPRIIDLDLLFYEDTILNTSFLTLPHPDIQNRLFVLRSLNEIAPNLFHPILKKTIKTIYQELLE